MAGKSNQTNLETLPACATKFIKLVIKKTRYRKKVRADVQAELVAHFEDELRDCKTDDEREQKAQHLIEQFGDAKLLGVLIRRAKKRCRPLWRTIVVRTFQTTGVLILCLIAYTVWFMTGKPVITTNYISELNRIVCPSADETDNAAPLYDKAVEICEDPIDYHFGMLRKGYHNALSEEKRVINEWIANNEPFLDMITAAAKKPYYWLQYQNNDLISTFTSELGQFRPFAWSLRWRANLRAQQGKYKDAFDDMISCYRMGRHLKGDKVLAEQFMGISIQMLATQTILNILSRCKIDSATLSDLQQNLEKIIADEDFVVTLKAEKAFIYHKIQRCYTKDPIGGGHLYLRELNRIRRFVGAEPFGAKNWTTLPQILFTQPTKKQAMEKAELYYTFWDDIFRKTPAQVRAGNIDPEKEVTKIIKKSLFFKVFVPVLTGINTTNYEVKSETQALISILALLRYRQDKGSYPDNLKKLITAGYLKQLPIDPFSDKPLIYRKIDGEFILYSVGRNFNDDGGKPAIYRKTTDEEWVDQGDAIYWPVQRAKKNQPLKQHHKLP